MTELSPIAARSGRSLRASTRRSSGLTRETMNAVLTTRDTARPGQLIDYSPTQGHGMRLTPTSITWIYAHVAPLDCCSPDTRPPFPWGQISGFVTLFNRSASAPWDSPTVFVVVSTDDPQLF